MAERKVFQMTQDDYAKLIEACRPTPLIALQCGMPPSPQESANRAWCELGDRMGFDGMTVEPAGDGVLVFTAVPKPDALVEA